MRTDPESNELAPRCGKQVASRHVPVFRFEWDNAMTLHDDTLWDSFHILRSKLTVASLALTLLQRRGQDAANRARAQAYLREALATMTREIAQLEHRALGRMETSAVSEDRLIATQVSPPRREDRKVGVDATDLTASALPRAAVRSQEQVLASQPATNAAAASDGGEGS